MNIDPLAAAGLVTREVRTGERGGTPTRTIVARRSYPTDQSDLWDVLTNPDRIPRWFLPVSGTLEAGGRYQLEGNAGGMIEACVEPESFAITWEYGGSTSWLVVSLRPANGETLLEVAHEAPDYPAFWQQYGPGATGLGWDLAIVALGQHLETGQNFGPDDEAAFSASPAGATFIESAAASWADAAIADGDDAEAARAAAERTVAFYTPPPDTDTE